MAGREAMISSWPLLTLTHPRAGSRWPAAQTWPALFCSLLPAQAVSWHAFHLQKHAFMVRRRMALTNPDSPVLRSMMARGSNLVSISVLNPPDCMGKWDGVSVCP